jgi:TolB protein
MAAVRRLTNDGFMKKDLCWSPDGKRLLLSYLRYGRIIVAVREKDGSFRLLTEGPPQFEASWSADAKKIAYVYVTQSGTDGELDLRQMNADGRNSEPLIDWKKSFEEFPSWSPDGKRLLFTSTRSGNQEIWVADAGGGNPKMLTNDPSLNQHPRWSPDGARIVFNSNREGSQDIYVMDADGSHLRRLTSSPALDIAPCWSPDGTEIAFTSNRDGNYEIYRVKADGSDARNLTRDPSWDHHPAWHPDGRRIAFVSSRDGGFDIYEAEAT